MGLLTSLALALIPLTRTRSGGELISPSKQTSELKTKIAELERDLGEARANAARWEALSNRWQARYEQAINPVLEEETRAQIRHQTMMMQAVAQMNYAQTNAQQMMYAQNLYEFCNCVPARHDTFRLGLGQ